MREQNRFLMIHLDQIRPNNPKIGAAGPTGLTQLNQAYPGWDCNPQVIKA